MIKNTKYLIMLILPIIIIANSCFEKIENEKEIISKIYNSKKGVSAHISFIETKSLFSNVQKYYLYYYNNKFGPYDSIENVNFLNQTDAITFTVKKQNKYYFNIIYEHLLMNNESGPFDKIYNIIQSFDGNSIYYISQIGIQFFIYKNTIKIAGPFDSVGNLNLIRDQNKYFYTVKMNNNFYLYLNNTQLVGPVEQQICRITFNSGGSKYAYTLSSENEDYVYIGQKRIAGPLKVFGDIKISHDGSTVIYVTEIKNFSMKKNDFETTFHPTYFFMNIGNKTLNNSNDNIIEYEFSEEGNVIYLARNGFIYNIYKGDKLISSHNEESFAKLAWMSLVIKPIKLKL